MFIHPIENTAVLQQNWVQVRPRITQLFGANPSIYEKFGMKGHNGIDWGIKVGVPLFAPCDGKVLVKDSGKGGYGLHIKIRSHHGAREVVLGHLSEVFVKSGDNINAGDKIALSGNTGFSTGPHLHMGYRKLVPARGDIFTWQVENYNNGYYGYVDFLPYIITWKGTHTDSFLSD